jgi:hypothetical protein
MHAKAQTVWVASIIETLKKSYGLFHHEGPEKTIIEG